MYFNIKNLSTAEGTRVDRIVTDATTIVTNKLQNTTVTDALIRPAVMELSNRIYTRQSPLLTDEITQMINDIKEDSDELGIFSADYVYKKYSI